MIIESTKPQLHISAMNMLSKCGEQYRRRYIEGEKLPPGIAAIVGTATDESVTQNLDSKIKNGTLLPKEMAVEIARATLVTKWDSEGVALDEDEKTIGEEKLKGEAIDKAVRLSDLHYESVAPELQPTHVQRHWTLELDGYPVDLAGAIDIQELRKVSKDGKPLGELVIVRDTKTAGKTPARDIADKSEQLSMYAMAVQVHDGRLPDVLALDYLIDLKTPKTETYFTTRTEQDMEPLLRRVENAVEATVKGVFVPARPDDWWCSKKFCGFHDSCIYTRKPVSISIPISL